MRKARCFDFSRASIDHDDVTKWKHFPPNWPFVRGIHRWPGNSPHKSQWRAAFMLPLICTFTNGICKQSRRRWFGTPSRPLTRHCNYTRIARSHDIFKPGDRVWKPVFVFYAQRFLKAKICFLENPLHRNYLLQNTPWHTYRTNMYNTYIYIHYIYTHIYMEYVFCYRSVNIQIHILNIHLDRGWQRYFQNVIALIWLAVFHDYSSSCNNYMVSTGH